MKLFSRLTVFVFLLAFAGLAVMAQGSGGARGRVRDQRGDGLAGVKITARQDGKEIKSVTSDKKGNFELRGLEAGVYNFVFERDGYSSGIKSNVEVKVGGTVNLGDNLSLAVDSGTLVLINGSVFNQDGRSLTGAKVLIERVNSDGSTKKIATVYTSVSGEFTLRQPPGAATYRVTASMKGVSGSKEVTVDSAGIYRLAIRLELPKE